MVSQAATAAAAGYSLPVIVHKSDSRFPFKVVRAAIKASLEMCPGMICTCVSVCV